MCAADRRPGAARYALALGVALTCTLSCALTATPVAAQDGFGGSFDSPGGGGSGGGSAPAPQNPPPSGNGFGGSFDTGADTGPDTGPGPAPAPAPDMNFDDQFDSPQTEPAPDQAPGPQTDPQLQAFEGRDFGVPPTNQLRADQMHAPTPTTLPGAAVVSTQGLAEAMDSGMQLVLIDVLGSDYSLPGALVAPALANSGHFRDRLQQQAGKWLRQVTQGETDMPIILYCSDPMCWLSYNATLRTVAAGYTNVYWYRGGLQAWQMAGLPLVPASF